jgi:putative ATP-dependent endonuclease of OLD family
LTQILQGDEAFKGKDEDHLLANLFKDFNEHVAKYFEGTDKDGTPLGAEHLKGKELKTEIDKFIQAFYSKDKESNFGVLGNNPCFAKIVKEPVIFYLSLSNCQKIT